MAGLDVLQRLLARVRGRIRTLAAVDGAVAGAAAGAAAAALSVPFVPTPWTLWAPVAGAVSLGFVGAIRRVGDARCARVVDRAAGGNADRVLVAVSFAEGTIASGLMKAAIADAAASVHALRADQVVPLRAPRGLGRLGLVAAGLAVLWTSGSRQRQTQPRDETSALNARVADAFERARASTNPALLAKAKALVALRETGQGEKLAAGLRALDAEIKEAAAEGRIARALAGAEDPSLRALARAVGENDTKESARTFADLSARAAAMNDDERQRLADAMAEAANEGAPEEAATDEGGTEADRSAPERHLERLERSDPEALSGANENGEARSEGDPAGGNPGGTSNSKQLQRDLEEAAEACRRDPKACVERLQQAANNQEPSAETPPAQESEPAPRDPGPAQAADGDAKAGASEEGSPSHAAESAAQQRFERSARGESDVAAKSEANGSPRGLSQTETARVPGAGRGEEAGGDPFGDASDTHAGAGAPSKVEVAAGHGESRAQVIKSSAQQGFAETGYSPVFRAYQAAVEETLDTTAVPPQRRAQVRRYFHLIRPR